MLLGEWVVASDMPRAVVTSTETKVSGSGSSSAANADVIFSLAAGTYNYSIAGFGKGDGLDFPDGAVPSVDNESFSDGRINLQWASSGLTITVTLTGLSTAVDATLSSVSDFATAFGAGTIV